MQFTYIIISAPAYHQSPDPMAIHNHFVIEIHNFGRDIRPHHNSVLSCFGFVR